MNKEKQCCYCDQPFTAKNSKARFCCTRHRVAQFRRQRILQNQVPQLRSQPPATLLEDIEELNKFREVLNGRP